ncbi:hypothetical protein LB505_013042 [Fusarium chuoi]|nr:hypothetical protein LB505_013042 [Fusarium chuoi]
MEQRECEFLSRSCGDSSTYSGVRMVEGGGYCFHRSSQERAQRPSDSCILANYLGIRAQAGGIVADHDLTLFMHTCAVNAGWILTLCFYCSNMECPFIPLY